MEINIETNKRELRKEKDELTDAHLQGKQVTRETTAPRFTSRNETPKADMKLFMLSSHLCNQSNVVNNTKIF